MWWSLYLVCLMCFAIHVSVTRTERPNLSNIHVPIHVPITILSRNGFNDIQGSLQQDLGNVLSVYTVKTDYGSIHYHISYEIVDKLSQEHQDFIQSYKNFIEKQPTITEDSRDHRLIKRSDLESLLRESFQNYKPTEKYALSFSSLPILLIHSSMLTLFPRHKIIYDGISDQDCDGSCYSIATQDFLFMDLSVIRLHAESITSYSINLNLIETLVMNIQKYLHMDTTVSDFMLSAGSVFVPVVTLHRLNTQTSNISDIISSIQSQNSLTSQASLSTLSPNTKTIIDWIDSYSINMNMNSVSITAANYYIDEHPQLAAAISSSLRKYGGKDIMYIDSKIFLNELKEIGDYFLEQLMDHSGLVSEFEFQRSLDRDLLNRLKTRESKGKLKDINISKNDKITSQKASKSNKRDNADPSDLLSNQRGYRLVYRRHAVLPVFVINNFFSSLDTSNNEKQLKSLVFETSSNIAIVDDVLMILHPSQGSQDDQGLELNRKIATGATECFFGMSSGSSEIGSMFASSSRAAGESVLSWKSKRSGVLLRSLRLINFVETTILDIRSHLMKSLYERNILSKYVKYEDIEISELFISSTSTDILSHFEKIQKHIAELENQIQDIQKNLLKPLTADEFSKFTDMLGRTMTSMDDKILESRDLEDLWDEMMLDARPAWNETIIRLDQLGSPSNNLAIKKRPQGRVATFLIVVFVIGVLSVLMLLMYKTLSEKAKKMK